jgi:hypothetical protein
MAMARHIANVGISHKPRSRKNEFCILLVTLRNGQVGNERSVKLFFAYTTLFEEFLSALNGETITQTGNGVGYTPEDGPWTYRMKTGDGTWGKDCFLNDEASFEGMLEKLRGGKGYAAVTHVSDASSGSETPLSSWPRPGFESTLDITNILELSG